MRHWVVIVMGCLLANLVWAAPRVDFTATPTGKRVVGYFHAFNSNDDAAIRAYISENYADSALAQRSVEDRLGTYRQLQRDMGTLELLQVLEATADRTTVLAHAQGNRGFQLTFLTKPRPPHKLLGIQVAPAEDAQALQDRSPLTEAAALDSATAYLERQAAADAFAGAVLIARSGQPLLRHAYGLADREHAVPNTPETRFNIGSINKTFTQLAIHGLVAAGKLALTDRVGKVLPDYPNATVREQVTVEQLLTHRAGVPDYFGEEFVNTPKDRLRTLADYLPLFASKPLLFAPGSEERYSNGGYIVLGRIIEQLSGKSYDACVRETIYDVAGMTQSGAFMADEIVPNRAVGYTHRWHWEREDDPELRSNVLVSPARGSSAGGGYSTVDDLLKFVTALEGGRFPGGLPGALPGALGIAGGAPGLNAAVESGIPGGYTVIVLANLDPPAAEQAARQIRQWLARVKA